jgi:hypothetical protein
MQCGPDIYFYSQKNKASIKKLTHVAIQFGAKIAKLSIKY